MTLVVGTNCGLVETAPTSDPTGGFLRVANDSELAMRIIPTRDIIITEIGWWCNEATQAANFEVGIYDHDSGVDRPEDLIHVDRTNAKGTDAGWKVVSGLSWNLTANTTYWIAFQLDDTASVTQTDIEIISGEKNVHKTGQSTLESTWTGTLDGNNNATAIYAVFESALKINIGDAWKDIKAIKINIGDAWKTVTGMQININGSEWKTVF